MSTPDTDPRPQIQIGPGGIYFYTDPRTGQTHSSPSYRGLLEDLETDTQAQDRASAQQDARARELAERRSAAAARLADLEPRSAAAETDRETAWEAFATAAVHGGALIDNFARFSVAHRRASALRLATADARWEAQHGADRGGGIEKPPPTLVDALTQVAQDRIVELRSQTAG